MDRWMNEKFSKSMSELWEEWMNELMEELTERWIGKFMNEYSDIRTDVWKK